MKDPPRLLDEGADAFERSLLASASRDVGSARLLKQTLSAAGVAAVSAAATTIAGSASAAGSAGASGAGVAGAAAKAETIALLKWILGGALAGVTTIGAYEYARPGEEARGSAPAPAVDIPAMRAPEAGRGARAGDAAILEEEAANDAEPASEPQRAPRIEPIRGPAISQPAAAGTDARAPEASAEPPPAANTPLEAAVASAAPAAPPRASPLTAEIASLDRARRAISARDAARALRELDRHGAEFPAGVLGPEATVLRIEALVLAGQRASARALADALLKSPANAAHATRVESLLRRPTNP